MGNLYRNTFLLALIFMVLTGRLFADPWADEVIEIEYGQGAGYGQDYFPQNILGPPDTVATETVPSATPEELLSLGSAGYVILAFNDGGIINGDGPDFTVFENVFLHLGEFPFQETAFVEVSADGENWIRFPYDDETLEGLAGVTPTNGSADPTDPSVSGGDSFDLETLGLSFISYVKLIDTEGFVADGGTSFDLDAVVAVNGEAGNSVVSSPAKPQSQLLISTWPNPFNSSLNVSVESKINQSFTFEVFNVVGRRVAQTNVNGNRWSWSPNNLHSGVYLLRVTDAVGNSTTGNVFYLK